MLVILSPDSVGSDNVLAEASFALDEGKGVIPVLYRECSVPFRLRPFQYVDFRVDYATGLEELLASLGNKQAAAGQGRKMPVAPVSDSVPAPQKAVFLSHAGVDPNPKDEVSEVGEVIKIAGRISRGGATVFLGEACMRPPDPESHVLNALSFADEVFILVTRTPADYLKERRTPAFLDRPLVWIAIGVALARGVPIRGLLLRGLTVRELRDDPTIPGFIQDRVFFQPMELYLADLRERPRKEHTKPLHRHGLRCRVCLCHSGRSVPAVSKLEKQLDNVGVVLNLWRPSSNVANFDAAVVVLEGQPPDDWKFLGVSFVESFIDRGKPVVLLSLPGAQKRSEVLDWLKPVESRSPKKQPGILDQLRAVEYRASDSLSFLRLLWAIVGYRQYDGGIQSIAGGPLMPKQRSGVFVSYSHEDKSWLSPLLLHLAPFEQLNRNIWTDQEIKPGAKWQEEIQDHLDTAQVAVLLVSPSYLNSPYIKSEELPKMLAAAESEGLVIFWIPVIASGVKETKIAQFQAAHDPKRPLQSLDSPHRAEAWVRIAEKLSEALGSAEGAGAGSGS